VLLLLPRHQMTALLQHCTCLLRKTPWQHLRLQTTQTQHENPKLDKHRILPAATK
jgi:hypothetical protein